MIRSFLNVLLAASGAALFLATVLLMYFENKWSTWVPPSASESEGYYAAFTKGNIGLEFLPLKYAAVLETVSASAFGLNSERPGVWQKFGFLRNPQSSETGQPLCAANVGTTLPFGMTVSNFIQTTDKRSPLAFVGLTCSACHSGVLRNPEGDTSPIIVGMGSPQIDLIAFTDGVRNAILDPELSAGRILDAYTQQCGDEAGGMIEALVERLILQQWLNAARGAVQSTVMAHGLPEAGYDLLDPAAIPAGPGRTRPFRSVIRVALDLPGDKNFAYSKIPAVFEQDPAIRPSAQFDGSINDPVTRSFIAAYASGASPLALADPEVEHNIRAAAAFTETLGITFDVPRYPELFPENSPEIAALEAGFEVYRQHCSSCHGYRAWSVVDGALEIGEWVAEGAYLHQHSFAFPEDGSPVVSTDDARVTFPHADLLALALRTTLPGWDEDLDAQREMLQDAINGATEAGQPAIADLWTRHLQKLNYAAREFRLGHPLYFPARDLNEVHGYINNPVPYAYLRGPYLHNGSVPTLRQLINLDRRPDLFCRGRADYSASALGFLSPPPDAVGRCPKDQRFLFDTKIRGNSNHGHDFPWAFSDPSKDAVALENLLEYLKIL